MTVVENNNGYWKVVLHNRCRGRTAPHYRETGRYGQEHDLTFTFEVQINGTTWGIGSGRSKSAAMEDAAEKAVAFGDEMGKFQQL